MSSTRLNVTARPPSPQSLDEFECNINDGGHDGDDAGQLVRLVVRRHGNARHAGGDGRLDAPARVFDGDGAMRIDAEPPRGFEVRIRRGLAGRRVTAADDGLKAREEAGC